MTGPFIKIEPTIIELLALLGEGRIVGGYVRDKLRNVTKAITDLDIATPLIPSEVIDTLSAQGIRVIPTGLKHGTVTALYSNYRIEITTLRSDVICYGRHAEVQFGKSWLEDAARRDFTINALYLDAKGVIHDYFGGINDLAQGKVKFIGNPEQRILEDHLRILRYFRFTAMLYSDNSDDHKQIDRASAKTEITDLYNSQSYTDSPSLSAVIKMTGLLQKISRERIREEMLKILCQPGVKFILMQMLNSNILDTVYLPFYKIQPLTIFKMKFSLTNPLLNLGALCSLEGWDTDDILTLGQNWRLSKKEIKDLLLLASFKPINTIIDHQRILYRYGLQKYELCLEMLKVMGNDSSIHLTKISEFPLKGRDILALGYRGIEVGKVMNKAEEYWLDSGCLLQKEELLQLISQKFLVNS